jgi:Cyclin M transmembrane N-terminal domain
MLLLRPMLSLPWCVYLLRVLLSPTVIDGSRHGHDDLNEVPAIWSSRKAAALQEASQLLASIEATGLCHPTLDTFAPLFPKCSFSPSPSLRRLENDKNYFQYYTYYDADDAQGDVYVDHWADGDTTTTNSYNNNNSSYPQTTFFYVINAVLTFVCVLVGSLSTAIHVGLLSLDPLLLVVKSRTSKSAMEKRRIETLLAIIKQKHQLAVTLVVTSCLAAEAMPVFLQRLVHDFVAILVSATLVILFGEILPSFVFTGVNQLEVASRCAPALRLWMCLLYPVVYPVARILEMLSSRGRDSLSASGDLGLGMGGTLYNRGELAALIRIQYEERRALRQRRKAMQKQHSLESIRNVHDDDAELSLQSVASPTASTEHFFKRRDFQRRASMSSIDSHDVFMVEGALQLKTKTAMDICQSWHKVFCIPNDMILDETNIFTIYASGYRYVRSVTSSLSSCTVSDYIVICSLSFSSPTFHDKPCPRLHKW